MVKFSTEVRRGIKLKIRRGNENLVINDDVIEGARKTIASDPNLLRRYNGGETLTCEVTGVNEKGKEETVTLELSKSKISCGFCEKELERSDATFSLKGFPEVFCSVQCLRERVAKILKVPSSDFQLPPISFAHEETPEVKVVIQFPEEMKLVLPRLRTRTTRSLDKTGRKVLEEGIIEDEKISVEEGIIEEFPRVEGRKYYFECDECRKGFEAEEPKITFSFEKEEYKFCSKKCFLKALSRRFKQPRLKGIKS